MSKEKLNLSEKSHDDLIAMLLSTKKEMALNRFKASVSPLKDSSVFKKDRKLIARINTEIQWRKKNA